jgi:hypothetical protein
LRWSQVHSTEVQLVFVIRPFAFAGGESSRVTHSRLQKICGDPYPDASSHSLAKMKVSPSLCPRYSLALRSVSWLVTKDMVFSLDVSPDPLPNTSSVARLPVLPLP